MISKYYHSIKPIAFVSDVDYPIPLHGINDRLQVQFPRRNILQLDPVLKAYTTRQGIAQRERIEQPRLQPSISDVFDVLNEITVITTMLVRNDEPEQVPNVI